MITLKITCAMCGKEHPQELNIEDQEQLRASSIQQRLEDEEAGWSLQINGGNLDTYCSKKCAA